MTALGFSGDAGLLAIGDRSGNVTLVRLDAEALCAGPACPPEVFAMRADCARSRLSLDSEVRALSLNGDGSRSGGRVLDGHNLTVTTGGSGAP